LTDSRQN